MVNDTRSYSTWQSNPSLSYVGRRTVSGAIVTLDIGSKYEVNLEAIIDGYGAGTKVYVRIGSGNGPIILIFSSDDDPEGTVKRVPTFIVDATAAGTNLWQNQNTGSNSGIDYIVTYRKIANPITPTITLSELKFIPEVEIDN